MIKKNINEFEDEVEDFRRVEQHSHESKSAFRFLFQGMLQGVALHELVHSPDGEAVDYRILDVNAAFERHTGITASRVKGRLASEAYGTHLAPYLETYERVARTGKSALFETYFAPLQKHFEVSVCPGDQRRFATIFTDITQRVQDNTRLKQTEKNLREVSERLLLATHAANVGIWDLDLVSDRLVWDEAMYGLYGLCPTRFDNIYQAWHERLHPEDRTRAHEEVQMALRGKRNLDTEFRVLWPDKTVHHIKAAGMVQRDCTGRPVRMLGINWEITDRRLAEAEHSRMAAIIRSAEDAIIGKSLDGQVLSWNEAAERIYGYSAAEMQGRHISILVPSDRRTELAQIRQQIELGVPIRALETVRLRKDGSRFPVSLTDSPVRDPLGNVIGASTIVRDITVQKQLESQLLQAQKLEAVGQLAAGIAHEINTPSQYVADNARFLQEAFNALQEVCQTQMSLLQAARNNRLTTELLDCCEEVIRTNDLDYLFKEIPKAVGSSLEGIERISEIVRAMKEFAHPGSKEKSPGDLNRAIETTVTVARNEWKYVADMKLDLDPALPAVPCFLGEFSQAILNLVVNAAHAVGDAIKAKPGGKGTITIRTRRDGEQVEVRVSDTGTGIPEAVRPHIFEPFFTTKGVGKGNGQGLTIVYSSIVKHHGGTVRFESECGKGTTFILALPIKEVRPVHA